LSGKNLVFDVETKRLAHEVGGWSHIAKLGLAAAVLLDVDSEKAMRFVEDDSALLINEILDASHVIGFNVLRFDYEVLRPYGLSLSDELALRTTDILKHVYDALGFRISLNNLAEATLQEEKSADGIQAVEWYREGDIEKVLDYCEQDVRVTYRIWRYGLEHKHVLFHDRNMRIRQVPVSW
jgi:DEAD/DEAH box helicase domain-containing protein